MAIKTVQEIVDTFIQLGYSRQEALKGTIDVLSGAKDSNYSEVLEGATGSKDSKSVKIYLS